jgi:hypothetical protein
MRKLPSLAMSLLPLAAAAQAPTPAPERFVAFEAPLVALRHV